MTGENNQKPTAFDLPKGKPNTKKAAQPTKDPSQATATPRALDLEDVELANEVVDTLDQNLEPTKLKKRGISWVSLFFSSLGLLLSLALGLMVDSLIRDLFSRYEWLGWVGTALTMLVVIAASAIIIREVAALMRLRKIEALRARASTAYQDNDKTLAEKTEREIVALYDHRADTASARSALETHQDEIIDGRGRITIIERELLLPLDERANILVMNAAKRVAVVTAISPRALVDIIYVLAENLRLIRAISDLYGGRPGVIGFVRLTRSVLAHLAVTGALSIGDGLVQQMVGHGLAARLSARFGEGVVNGLLTARVGLAAHDICRPISFLGTTRPSVSKYMNALIGMNAGKDTQ